jgi:hypothetical protein
MTELDRETVDVKEIKESEVLLQLRACFNEHSSTRDKFLRALPIVPNKI